MFHHHWLYTQTRLNNAAAPSFSDRNIKRQHRGLRTGWVLPPEKPKSFPTNSVLVGESRLEWPSFIKHSAPADRAQRSQRVYTTAQQGPQDWTDEDAHTYSFTHPHTHLLKLCRARAFSCLFSKEYNLHLWWGALISCLVYFDNTLKTLAYYRKKTTLSVVVVSARW